MRYLTATIYALLALSLPLQAGPLRRNVPNRLRAPRLFTVPHLRAAPVSPRPSAVPVDQAAQELLKKMLQAENSLALTGDQTTMVAHNGLDISSEQQIYRNGARSLRIDYLRPPRLAGEQIVDNGRFYCHLIPARDTLELSPSKILSLRVRVPEVIRQIKSGQLIVQSAGQETVAGHDCGIVTVAARISVPAPSRRFWIDLTNGAQLRIEQYDTSGKLQSASYYTQVTYNPRFEARTFRVPLTGSKVVMTGFAAPSLTLEQVRAQAGVSIPTPSALPEGFRFQAGSVSDNRGRRVIELRYLNGANILSVFMTPDETAAGPSKTEHPRHGVLFGRQAGMKVVIIGNQSKAELEQVLTSLR